MHHLALRRRCADMHGAVLAEAQQFPPRAQPRRKRPATFNRFAGGSSGLPQAATKPLEAPSAFVRHLRQSYVRAPAPSAAPRGRLCDVIEKLLPLLGGRLSPLSVAVAAKTRRSVAGRFYGLRPFSVRTLHASKTTRSRIGLTAWTPAFEYLPVSGAPCGSPEAAASHSAAYGRAARKQR